MNSRIVDGCRYLFFFLLLLAFSCSPQADHEFQANATAKVLNNPSPTPFQLVTDPIRGIDFGNVAYPNFPVYTDERGAMKRVTLRPGEVAPRFANYGDATGDGKEEAMVALGIQNRGSAIPDYVYIYALEKEQLTLLWDFQTGDRADGGLRQIYAKDGELVVELFGRNRVIGKNCSWAMSLSVVQVGLRAPITRKPPMGSSFSVPR